MAKDSRIPAFPIPAVPAQHAQQTGMSLREWYAGLAMQGILAATEAHAEGELEMTGADVARRAFEMADAMIYKIAE